MKNKREIDIRIHCAISNGTFADMKPHFQALSDLGFEVEVEGDDWEESFQPSEKAA